MYVFNFNNILAIQENKISSFILLIEGDNYTYHFVTVTVLKMFRIRMLLFCFMNVLSLISRQIAQNFARRDYLLIKICSRNEQRHLF